MNNNDKTGKITLIIGIIIIILTVLGVVGIIYAKVSYNKKIEDATSKYRCPISIYDIVDGTKITSDMVTIKTYDNVDMDTYICTSSLIVGKCVNKNTVVKKNEMFKYTDLVDCEE